LSLFFMKSVLSLLVLCLSIAGMFTMFEIFGRSETTNDIARLKRLHKAGGYLYLLLFVIVSYYCLKFLVLSKVELSPRGALHSLIASAVVILFVLKIFFVRVYRQYYNQAKIFGLLIGLMTFGMFWTSGGYYLLVTGFGTYKGIDRIIEYRMRGQGRVEFEDAAGNAPVKTDPASISRGKKLFEAKCSACHDPYRRETIVGPGLRGLLKRSFLPASGRPATPENVRRQLREPFEKMPSFAYLSDEEVADLLAFLNTL
jgi:mono/diheme cytochrome c family protein